MAGSNSVARAAQILKRLAEADGPLTLAMVSRDLQIPKSTAHSILSSLVAEQFVVSTLRGYVVGLAAFEVGASHLRSLDSTDVIRGELGRLTSDLGATAHWAVVDGLDAVYLAKENPPGLHVRLASSLGARLPAYSTAVGKSCLAWLPPQQRLQHLPEDLDEDGLRALDAEFTLIQERGYSTDEGYSARGVMCVAAPLRTAEGITGAIGVSYLDDDQSDLPTVSRAVMETAERASALLGGRNAS